MTQENTKRVEIDVLALLQKLWTKKVFILFTAFYVAVFAFLGTYFFIQPTYTSSTRIYVVNQADDGKNLSAQDLQAGTFLTKGYKEIITSNDVLSEVIKDEKLNMTEADLAKMISVNIPTDTRLISISVNAKTGQDAQSLANKVRDVAAEKIKKVKMSQRLKMRNCQIHLLLQTLNVMLLLEQCSEVSLQLLVYWFVKSWMIVFVVQKILKTP